MVAALVLGGCQDYSDSPESGRLLGKRITFKATYETPVSVEGTKTVLHTGDDGKDHVYWTSGDAISLFYGSGSAGGAKFTADITEDSRQATFSGNIGAVTGLSESSADDLMFWGLYPYDPAAECDGRFITTTLLSMQEGRAGTFAPGYAPSLGRAAGLLLSFRNIYSGLWFTVTQPGFRRATFRSNAGEPVAGRVKVGVDASGQPFISEVLDGVSSVTVTAPGGGTFEVGKKYYLIFLPQTLSSGFSVDLDSTTERGVFTVAVGLTFGRNQISSITNLDTKSTFSPLPVTQASFEDEHFANYVFSNFDGDGDGVLSNEECNAVTDIQVCTDTIASMRGIEYFPNLENLSCSGTLTDGSQTTGLLTALDISSNVKLKTLVCDCNQLVSLDVSANTALTSLICRHNLLTSLVLGDKASLTSLNFHYNQIASVDLSGCPALAELYCMSNQLASLDLSGNTALVKLICSVNKLPSLDVSANTALTWISCRDNSLQTLDIRNNTSLTILDCQRNQLTALDVSRNTALTELVCSSNQLTTLNVSGNAALTDLGCLRNPMSTLYLAYGQTFKIFQIPDTTEIVYLVGDLGGNAFPDVNFRKYVFDNFDTDHDLVISDEERLAVIDIDICTDNVASLDGIGCFVNIHQLSCYGSDVANRSGLLTSLDLSALKELRSLNCAGNNITALDLSPVPLLRSLKCEWNQLTALDFSYVGEEMNYTLEYLNCSGNQLTSLDVSSLYELDDLKCGNNKITSLIIHRPSFWRYMTKLDCRNNQLANMEDLDLSLCGFEELYCGGNPIQSLDLSSTSVTKLNCQGVPATTILLPRYLKEIDGYAFQGCTYLTELVLPETVTDIGEHAFANCPALMELKPHGTVPPNLGDDAFTGSGNCLIYVASTAVNTFMAAPGWSVYADRIRVLGRTGGHEQIGYDDWE